MEIGSVISCAVPVVGQIISARFETGTKSPILATINTRQSPTLRQHLVSIEELQDIQQEENAILLGSLFQAVVSVGLAAVLKWSVLGIGGMVAGVGFFAVACYWRWQTSRYIGSEQSEYNRLWQRTVSDNYTNWKKAFMDTDSGGNLVVLDKKDGLTRHLEIFPGLPDPDLIPEIPALTDVYRLRIEWEREMNFYFLRENNSRVPLKQNADGEKAFTAFQAAMDKYLALQF